LERHPELERLEMERLEMERPEAERLEMDRVAMARSPMEQQEPAAYEGGGSLETRFAFPRLDLGLPPTVSP